MHRIAIVKMSALVGLLALAGCGDQAKTRSAADNSGTDAPAAEIVQENEDGTTATGTVDYSTSGPAVAELIAKYDVGIDGLKAAAKSLDDKIRPLVENSTERLSVEAVDDLTTLSRGLMTHLQNSSSVESNLRMKIYNVVSGIHSAFKEMRDEERGERYEELRKSVLDNLENLKAVLPE